MKYHLIAGEASGDLHASHLMLALKRQDADAQFRFIGGDQMAAVGGTAVRHYREMAYMGFVPVLMHLPTILRNMRLVKSDIREWQPDVVILVDYPGFNLAIAKYVHAQLATLPAPPKVCYYILPKIWAWKEYRIKNIKRDIDELLSILPFEVQFFEGRHHQPIHYVGNPTYDEVHSFLEKAAIGNDDFLRHHVLSPLRPIIAVLCGSRKQEIAANLPSMLQATDRLPDNYQVVIAGAPGIDHDYYSQFTQGHRATVLHAGQTYQLLYNAHAALVTSGTATLETALFGVPQVVCYATAMPRLFGWLRRRFLKVRYVSLVNLIADREVVPELVADGFSTERIGQHLGAILDGKKREQMLNGYKMVEQRLKPFTTKGEATRIILKGNAADNAAAIITNRQTT